MFIFASVLHKPHEESSWITAMSNNNFGSAVVMIDKGHKLVIMRTSYLSAHDVPRFV